MSRASLQESFIRAMVLGLCRTLELCYQGQPRQKLKLQAAAAIRSKLDDLCRLHPIQLTESEKGRVIVMIRWCEALPDADYSKPEVLIGVCLALVERLRTVTRDLKQVVAGDLAVELQRLYDTYDRLARPDKLDLLLKGGSLADKMLMREI